MLFYGLLLGLAAQADGGLRSLGQHGYWAIPLIVFTAALSGWLVGRTTRNQD